MSTHPHIRNIAAALSALLILPLCRALPASAKNVDLVTLPKRDSVQLTIYNSEDLTLVKETRYITLKKGANSLQFSWAGTLIDPTSVHLRPLEHADEIEVADTVFPGQKPQHLIWNIDSKIEGQVKVEVSYFTSGLTWSMDYVAVADPEEKAMQFRGYVRVFNNSGEEYENAEVRLIVGRINLVEKIADLAQRQGVRLSDISDGRRGELRKLAVLEVMDKAQQKADLSYAQAAPAAKPKEIVKEGLSEYFMFTVEGAETIPNGWSKRMQAVKADEVGFDIVYRMRSWQYGPRPVRFFIWRNDAEHKLGESPLPDGRVRVFRQKDAEGGLSYLGEQLIRYVPVKAEIEVNLGPDDLVVYETRQTSTERFNFSFKRDNQGKEWVIGWDEKTRWIDTIRNYRSKPITFELRRQWPGHVDYDSEVATTLFDYQTIDTKFKVDKLGKKEYPAIVVTHLGSNAGQSRIDLKKLAAPPAETRAAAQTRSATRAELDAPSATPSGRR